MSEKLIDPLPGNGACSSPKFRPHAPAARQKRVVLAMDNRPARLELADALSALRYSVLQASDVATAQGLARDPGEIALLFIDLSDSEQAGRLLALFFRTEFPEVQVVLASDALAELNCGIVCSLQIALLAKPCTPLQMARFIRRCLRTRRRRTKKIQVAGRRRPGSWAHHFAGNLTALRA